MCHSADAQPTADEQSVFDSVNTVLTQTNSVLGNLAGYTGAGEEIRVVSFEEACAAFLVCLYLTFVG